MTTRKALSMNVYFAVAHWLWGVRPEDMMYGPPDRNWKDRLAMRVYNRGIRIQHQMTGSCPECGRRR